MSSRSFVPVAWLMLLMVGVWACSSGNSEPPAGDEDYGPYSEYEIEEEDFVDGDQDDVEWDRWEPGTISYPSVADTPFKQWRARTFSSADMTDPPQNVRRVLSWVGGGAYIGAENGLYYWDTEAETLTKLDPPAGVTDFQILDLERGYDNTLYILAVSNISSYLYSLRYQNQIEIETDCLLGHTPTSLTSKGTSHLLYIGTTGGVYEFNNTECFRKANYPEGYVVDFVADEENRVAVMSRLEGQGDTLHLFNQNQWFTFDKSSGLLDARPTSLAFYSDDVSERDELWIAYDDGLQVMNVPRRTFTSYRGAPCDDGGYAEGCGLPWSDIGQIAVAPDGVVWASTEKAALRIASDGEVGRKAFYSHRWLLDDAVLSVGFDSAGSVWLGHADGLTQLRTEDWTLAGKAAHFRSILTERHLRPVGDSSGGFSARCSLANPGDTSACDVWREADESLWTGMYALAELFRLGASQDQDVKEESRQAAKGAAALVRELERATQVDGLPARSIVPRDYWTPGDPEAEGWNRSDTHWWLGDTGSDSIVGHVLLSGFYYDIIFDEAEKSATAETLGRIAAYIQANGWRLIDITGDPTSSGHWEDEWVTGTKGIDGGGGLSALQLLALLRVAYHVTGDENVFEAYIERAHDAEYAQMTRHQKTLTSQRESNHSDDQLAFLSYLSLLRYADIVDFRDIYMASLQEAFAADRPESSALFNLITGVYTYDAFDLEEAVALLQDAPLDLIDWRVDTCWRMDVTVDAQPDREGKRQLTTVLPLSERKLMRWDANPYTCEWADNTDDPLGGWSEDDGVYWLLPYWLGRYYHMIDAPATVE